MVPWRLLLGRPSRQTETWVYIALLPLRPGMVVESREAGIALLSDIEDYRAVVLRVPWSG